MSWYLLEGVRAKITWAIVREVGRIRTCQKTSFDERNGSPAALEPAKGAARPWVLEAQESLQMPFELRRFDCLYMSAIADALNTAHYRATVVRIF